MTVHAPRAGLVIALAGGLLLLGAVALLLSLQSTVLDRTAVERDVAIQFEEREGVAVALRCEEEMQVHARAVYECAGTTSWDEEITLRITVTDESTAAYTWTEP